MVFSFFSKWRTSAPGSLDQSDLNCDAQMNSSSESGIETKESPISGLSFQFPLRRYQQEILELVKLKVEKGEKQLHVVAPPGAGKTIIGLQLIAEFREPALVVCPTTTIQAQWGQKLDLFLPPDLQPFGVQDLIGTHEDKPLKPITLLTYQVLSTPGREQEYLEKLAQKNWVEELYKGAGLSQGEAELRILELLQNNPRAHAREMSRHVSRLRRKLADVIDLKEVLHPNAISLLQALRRQKFKVVIFDECHHLTDYWAAIMTHVIKQLDDAVVIGLTGTPPEGKSSSQETRYMSLVGEIDYQVPTPALVKEAGLAPFQDLVYFTEPTEKEDKFLEEQHAEFHRLLEELIQSEPPLLTQWVIERMTQLSKESWESFYNKTPSLATAMARYMWKEQIPLPAKVELSEALMQSPIIDDWMELLEDFALNFLKLSASTDNHKLYDRIKHAVAKLGFGLTEKGLRKQASPVDRVLAFSRGKTHAVADILTTEFRNLEDRLRCAVVTDFEKMSATAVKTAKGVLTPESGGAVAVLRELLDSEIGYFVNPCMVTGSLLLVDRRIAEKFVEHSERYLRDQGHDFKLIIKDQRVETRPKQFDAGASDDEEDGGAEVAGSPVVAEAGADLTDVGIIDFDPDTADIKANANGATAATAFDDFDDELPADEEAGQEPEESTYVEITAGSNQWEARLYVGMATYMLELGITKCLIGTRGIFGEGWDCQALNTLIDLTTTTTPVSVKQLRGRSIRLNVNDPLGNRKVANNWDVVCIAPHLEKGLNDYHRFVRKHEGYFGISDDGQIECGVGHVHPSFSELTPAEVFAQFSDFNAEMLNRALVRDQIYELWKVGQPYNNRCLGCVEVSALRKMTLTPPNIKRDLTYKEHAQLMRASLNGVWLEYCGLGGAMSAGLAFLLAQWGVTAFAAFVPFAGVLYLGRKKYKSLFDKFRAETCRPNTQDSSLVDIGIALLVALQNTKFLPKQIAKESIKVTMRSDGSHRVFLDDVEPQHSEYFAKCLQEVLAPISNQPYLIPKYEFSFPRPKKKRKRETADGGRSATKLSGDTPSEPIPVWNRNALALAKPTQETHISEEIFFKAYLKGKAEPRIASYHAVPALLARSEKGRDNFESAWNKYVSPGSIVAAETKPELINKYFGIGPSLAKRMLWE